EANVPGVFPHQGNASRHHKFTRVARAFHRCKAYGVGSNIKTESLFVACLRLEILNYEVFRPVARRLDGEIRITTHIETGVTPYRRFVVALLLQGHPSIEADNLNSGIASIQIEAQDITPKCVAADRLRSTEQSTHPVQNIGIGLQAPLDGILGIAYVVFKSHPRC